MEILLGCSTYVYFEAFEAVLVMCQGWKRKEYGVDYFDHIIEDGPFSGQHGLTLYYLLLAKITANIMQSYLKLDRMSLVVRWGDRAIRNMHKIARTDNDLVALGTPVNDTIGRIFYRVGLAYKADGEDGEARHHFRVASEYLPEDQQIKKDLASVALQIGI